MRTLLYTILTITLVTLLLDVGGRETAQSTIQWPTSAEAATDPVLYFSDLTSGPKSSNSDTSGGRTGLDGAIVTLWGRNLGSAQGSSRVYANGVEASSYYSWGNATAPADLYTYHQMQMISFQVSRLAQDGPGQIYVVVGGKQSNTLPFTVRSGNIYFATTSGNDDTGNGSWSNPWRTIPKAADSLAPGDIAYIGDGVNQTTVTDYDAAVNLGTDGTEANPIALLVYPGATSTVGNSSITRAFWVWATGTGHYSVHWVLSKFNIVTAQTGIYAQSGFRVVGNHVTAPNGDGAEGAIGAVGSDIDILGNELENVGGENSSKLYHAIYVTGVRQDSPPRPPAESNREVAWNYIHDNRANRAINIYSEQPYSAFIERHRIHDNVIVNQRGDGILLGYYVTSDNWIYNNLVVNAGLGPEWPDDPSYHTGIRINAGHENVAQTAVYLYNNTLYGNGWAGAIYEGETGSLLFDPWALDHSMLYLSNNIIFSTGEPYMAGESTSLPSGDYRNCWYGDGAAPAWDTTAINDDPDFVNAAAFHFQLLNGSSCIDAGRDVSAVVARDLLGVARPEGLAFDLGAYEYVSGSPSPTLTPTATSTPSAGSANSYLPLVLRAGGTSSPTPTSTATATPTPTTTASSTETATPTPTVTPSPTLPAGAVTLATLGDSLTEGDGDDYGRGGFPGRLLPLLQGRRAGSTVTNLGHSGWDSNMLINGDGGVPSQLSRAVTLLNQAAANGQVPMATVWIGSNDLWYLYSNEGETPPDEEQQDVQHFTGNIDTILSQLRATGATVFIALLDDQSLRPVASDPALRAATFPGISAAEVLLMSQQVTRYNNAIAGKAAQHGAITVDFYHTTIFTDPATLNEDGNHPNAAGYDLIAQIWFDAISPALP